MYKNVAQIQDLLFSDFEVCIRPMCVDAIHKKKFHDGKWDVAIYLTSGKIISITLDGKIVDKVIRQILGFPQEFSDEI